MRRAGRPFSVLCETVEPVLVIRGLQCLMLGAVLVVGACAFDVIHVRQVPAALEPLSGPAPEWTLAQDVNVRLREGFASLLKTGTTWRAIGRIPQGDVFRTSDQVVTVEASNVSEAALVLRADVVIGFYLMVEHTFTEAAPQVEIKRVIKSP